MTLSEIKAAVDAGKTVHWMNNQYTVIKDNDTPDHYLIQHEDPGKHWIGLTWKDGVTLNGEPEQFFLAGSRGLWL